VGVQGDSSVGVASSGDRRQRSAMPNAVKADHTIATPRSSELAGRTSDKAVANPTFAAGPVELRKTRKTPSPTAKPPSPTNARLKTPSPTIAPVRVLPERKSPSSSQRLSPTGGKGGASPTESSRSIRADGKATRKGNSPDAALQLLSSAPPAHALPAHPSRHALQKQLSRSKSSMSYPEAYTASQRKWRGAGRAACTPEATPGWEGVQTERVGGAVEMRDSSTQTVPVCNAGTQTWLGEETAEHMAPRERATSDNFFNHLNRFQGDLAMAMQASMEQLAEYSVGGASNSPAAQPQRFGRFLPRPTTDQGSDEECDEVRSLSLSEEGPVICKYPMGRGAADAPDPIAMLSDGQRKAIDSSTELDEGDLAAPDSDRSAATTRLDDPLGSSTAERSSNHDLLNALAPLFSKLSNQLEVVPEQAAALAKGGCHATRKAAVRVKPQRASANIQALNLSQVRLPSDSDSPRPFSPTRSDISIGSAQSAFSSWSSPCNSTGSFSASPRNRQPGAGRGLTATASMPSLTTKPSLVGKAGHDR